LAGVLGFRTGRRGCDARLQTADGR
jgi:hypothetical protein